MKRSWSPAETKGKPQPCSIPRLQALSQLRQYQQGFLGGGRPAPESEACRPGCHRSLMSPPEAWPECRVTTVASNERLGVCNLLWPPEAASVECVTYCGLQRLGVCNVLWPPVAWSVLVTCCSFQRAPGVCNLLWPPAQGAWSV